MEEFYCDYLDYKYVQEPYVELNTGTKITLDEAIDITIKYNNNSFTREQIEKDLIDSGAVGYDFILKHVPQNYDRTEDFDQLKVFNWLDKYAYDVSFNISITQNLDDCLVVEIEDDYVEEISEALSRSQLRYEVQS
jgi:hypothetical protein